MASYGANDSGERAYTNSRSSEYAEVNELLYEWYKLACSKNIFPGGAQLTEKAKEIAVRLGKPKFSGSNGWLHKWKVRYNIKQVIISGESGDVRGDTVESWKERLPELLRGFSREDIWNLDETGCFWKALPDRGFGQKGKRCKGGKKSKQRVTVAFIINAAGGKETPIVIGASENPRCFKGLDKTLLPVKYFSQKKAWMSGEILDKILTNINRKLSSQSRTILLLMDNAGCHPEQFKNKYSNVKIIFLPPNTSKLQPLDLGVIQNFKTHYRHFLLRFILAKMDECNTASEVTKSVNLLTAIRWIARAWEEVSPITICKCYRGCGILNEDMTVVSRGLVEEIDPFDELDVDNQLQDLIGKVLPTSEKCTADEYICGENTVPVCAEYDDESWEESFFTEIGESSLIPEEEQSEGENNEEGDLDPPSTGIKTLKEAIKSIEDVQNFLDSHGYVSEATHASSLICSLTSLNTSSKQTSLLDYFEQR